MVRCCAMAVAVSVAQNRRESLEPYCGRPPPQRNFRTYQPFVQAKLKCPGASKVKMSGEFSTCLFNFLGDRRAVGLA